jgi:hypothetical protein
LRGRGVSFEDDDFDEMKTENGVLNMPGGYKAAWFKDSEGNTLELSETPRIMKVRSSAILGPALAENLRVGVGQKNDKRLCWSENLKSLVSDPGLWVELTGFEPISGPTPRWELERPSALTWPFWS